LLDTAIFGMGRALPEERGSESTKERVNEEAMMRWGEKAYKLMMIREL